MSSFSNVFQPALTELDTSIFSLKGKWNAEHFKNENPIVVELGCGKGEYTVGMAQKFPLQNHVGIDIKGARIWKGAKHALENKLHNAAFVRTFINRIENIFAKDEVSAIWLTFPDPQPQKSLIKKRLTNPVFLGYYKKILKPDSIIHLKTDNVQLFDYTLEVIEKEKHILLDHTYNLYESSKVDDVLYIKTYYESGFLEKGLKICYLKFKLRQEPDEKEIFFF